MPKVVIEIHIRKQIGDKQIAKQIRKSITASMQAMLNSPYIEKFETKIE